MFTNVLLKKQYYFFFIYKTDGEELTNCCSRQVGFLPLTMWTIRGIRLSNPVMPAFK